MHDGTDPRETSPGASPDHATHPEGPVSLRIDEQGVAELWMHDDARKNAFSREFVDALLARMAELSRDRRSKVCILRGLPEVFCAGGDRRVLLDLAEGNLAPYDLELTRTLLELPVPTIAAIEGHAEEFRQRTGIQCKFTERKIPGLADRNRETAIFRICQEALTNVARHSNATEVSIRLNQQNGSVVLQVQDNGKGITAKEVSDSRSLGLLGMRERALLFGGEISFYGAPGKGTRVTATIPLNHTEKA